MPNFGEQRYLSYHDLNCLTVTFICEHQLDGMRERERERERAIRVNTNDKLIQRSNIAPSLLLVQRSNIAPSLLLVQRSNISPSLLLVYRIILTNQHMP